MTREEFNNAVLKLKQDYVPAVKDECVTLGHDKIELNCSEEQLATASNARVDFGGYPSQWIGLLLRFPKLKCMLFNDCYCQPDNGSGWRNTADRYCWLLNRKFSM